MDDRGVLEPLTKEAHNDVANFKVGGMTCGSCVEVSGSGGGGSGDGCRL